MNDPTLQFDHASHTYRLGDRVLPSVTQVVRAVLPYRHPADEWYLQRGTMIHKAAALMLRGELDETSIDPRISGHVEAVRKAISEMQLDFKGARIEVPMASPLGYAGTPDIVLRNGLVVDWKSSVEPQVLLQLGGYLLLAGGKSCASVELRENGTYRFEQHDSRRAKGLFLNALSIFQWKVAVGA